MTAWTSDELERIGAAEELETAPLCRDGALRNPVTIWVVRHGDDLYVRSVNGPDDLDGNAEAYATMDERRAIKSLVRVGTI